MERRAGGTAHALNGKSRDDRVQWLRAAGALVPAIDGPTARRVPTSLEPVSLDGTMRPLVGQPPGLSAAGCPWTNADLREGRPYSAGQMSLSMSHSAALAHGGGFNLIAAFDQSAATVSALRRAGAPMECARVLCDDDARERVRREDAAVPNGKVLVRDISASCAGAATAPNKQICLLDEDERTQQGAAMLRAGVEARTPLIVGENKVLGSPFVLPPLPCRRESPFVIPVAFVTAPVASRATPFPLPSLTVTDALAQDAIWRGRLHTNCLRDALAAGYAILIIVIRGCQTPPTTASPGNLSGKRRTIVVLALNYPGVKESLARVAGTMEAEIRRAPRPTWRRLFAEPAPRNVYKATRMRLDATRACETIDFSRADATLAGLTAGPAAAMLRAAPTAHVESATRAAMTQVGATRLMALLGWPTRLFQLPESLSRSGLGTILAAMFCPAFFFYLGQNMRESGLVDTLSAATEANTPPPRGGGGRVVLHRDFTPLWDNSGAYRSTAFSTDVWDSEGDDDDARDTDDDGDDDSDEWP